MGRIDRGRTRRLEGERVMWKKSIMLVQLELGGYIVKEHDVYNNQTAILFA